MSFFKKSSIRFDGQKEIETKLKNQTENVVSRRFKILMIVVGIMGILLLARLFLTQITERNYYRTKLSQYNTGVFTTDTFRGNIYDRNYNRLVYNKNINCATYYAIKKITDEELESIAKFLVEHVNVDTKLVTSRDKKDYLIMKDEDYVKSLLTPEELIGDSETVYNLELSRITDDILNEKLSDYDIKFYMLFFKMKNCRTGSTVLLEGLSIKEASLIGENSNILRGIKVTNDWSREYTYDKSFKQVLGNVTTKKAGLPATTKDLLLAMDYNNDSRVGVAGLEQQYENLLSGTSAKYSIRYDTDGNPVVESLTSGSKGENLRLTIDWELQEEISQMLEDALMVEASTKKNNNIFLTMMDPNNGEILVMAGKQKDPQTNEIYDFAAGNYLNAYEIGSTFKGVTVYTGFKYNLINENTHFMDDAKGIKIKGTNTKKSYKPLGYLDAVQALSKSSNVFMYYIAIRLGNGEYRYDQPLSLDSEAFDTLRLCAGELGLGVKTGLDVPYEEMGYHGKITSRQPGNLLDFAIGQYDTYTTVQMAQYVSTIANGGKRIRPHLFLDSFTENEEGNKLTISQYKILILDDVSQYKKAFEIVQKGFRTGAVSGLAHSVEGYYNSAGKTGTAQVFDVKTGVEYANRAYIGYAPYDKPQIAIACITEKTLSHASCQPIAKAAFTKYFDKYGVKSE